jgi:hypothetical protein
MQARTSRTGTQRRSSSPTWSQPRRNIRAGNSRHRVKLCYQGHARKYPRGTAWAPPRPPNNSCLWGKLPHSSRWSCLRRHIYQRGRAPDLRKRTQQRSSSPRRTRRCMRRLRDPSLRHTGPPHTPQRLRMSCPGRTSSPPHKQLCACAQNLSVRCRRQIKNLIKSSQIKPSAFSH